MKFPKPCTGGSCNVAATAHASRMLLLPLVFMLLATSTCLGLPLESTTTTTDIDEVTVEISPQQPMQQPVIVTVATAVTAASVPNAVNISETTVSSTETSTTTTATKPAEPIESDVSSDIGAEIADNSFVPLGENLEQNIRNAVKSEVESEIEAEFTTFVKPLHQQKDEASAETTTVENEKLLANQENAIQNVREPKTLNAETAAEADAQPTLDQRSEQQTQLDNDKQSQAVNAEVNEAEVQVSEAVTDNIAMECENDPSEVIEHVPDDFGVLQGNTMGPTDLLALERELNIIEMKETTPTPTYELTKHQVTKKQGVENYLPMEEQSPIDNVAAPKTTEIRNERQQKLEVAEVKQETSVNFNEIEQNTIESEEKQTKLKTEAASELDAKPESVQESVSKLGTESSPESVQEPVSNFEPESSSESAQESVSKFEPESTPQSAQESVLKLEPESSSASAEETASKLEPESAAVSKPESKQESRLESLSETEPKSEQKQELEIKNVSDEKNNTDEDNTGEKKVVKSTEIVVPEIVKPIEHIRPILEASTNEQTTNVASVKAETEINEVSNVEAEPRETTSESMLNEPSSTVRVDVLAASNSLQDKSSEEEDSDIEGSGESVAKNVATERAVAQVNNDSSEEDEQPVVSDLSLSKLRSDDSTATPLVSYPPHNAGQTFNDNLADERTAHLSLESTNRSALIIVLCSGTAVLFIVISLIIFVVSFQRQHGTLDIEMQEQRLGKDDLDEENVQMNLLDVDLSSAAVKATQGNEETDECL